jgi:ketosteroid isomerase-like protein
MATARRFADALDAEDYPALSRLLTSDCEYLGPQGARFGPQAVVASYRRAGTWARSKIEKALSGVASTGPSSPSIHLESKAMIAEDAAALVQRQLTAYNAKDVQGWLNTYAPEAEQCTFRAARLARGHAELQR